MYAIAAPQHKLRWRCELQPDKRALEMGLLIMTHLLYIIYGNIYQEENRCIRDVVLEASVESVVDGEENQCMAVGKHQARMDTGIEGGTSSFTIRSCLTTCPKYHF